MYLSGMRGYGRRGLRGLRRGLGQTPDVSSTVTYLPSGAPSPEPVPGFNQMIATPLTPAQIAALSAFNAAYFNQPTGGAGGGGNATGGQSFTQWLNSNALTAIIGTAIFLVGWKAFSK